MMMSAQVPTARTKRAHFVLPNEDDVDRLLADVRKADRDEWVAFSGFPMRDAMRYAIEHHSIMCVLEADRSPLCIMGAHDWPEALGPQPEGTGLLWFAATNNGYNHIPDFVALTNAGLRWLHDCYPRLVAYSDARNVIHHQWLAAMGFNFTDFAPVGPFGLEFFEVEHVARSARGDAA